MPKTDNKLYTTTAICLKTYPYGEADRILHLYSPDCGRISAIAKGVRKQGSKLAGACEVLHISRSQFSRGKNLDVLSQYEPHENFIELRTDLLKLSFGSLFAELVHRIAAAHDQDSRQVFEVLQTALADLASAEAVAGAVVPVAVRFQLALLEATGYRPDLAACMATGDPLDTEDPYYAFSADLGGIVRRDQTHRFPETRWVNVSTRTLLAINGFAAGEACSPETYPVKTMVKAQRFLRYYYEYLHEGGIRAWDFALQMLETGEG